MRNVLLVLTLLVSALGHAEVGLVYTFDVATNLQGGLKRGTQYLDNLEASYTQEFTSGEFTSTLLYTNSNAFSEDFVGDTHIVSNIDNNHMLRLFEFWYRHDFSDQSIQLGLTDLNGRYDVIESAGLFINSSHGIGPDFSQSGLNGPSIFPVTSLALNYQRQISETFTWQIGIFDAVPGDPLDPHKNTIKLSSDEGALVVTELDWTSDNYRLAAGVWRYSEAVEYIDGSAEAHNTGHYGIIEGKTSDAKDWRWWIRAGRANEDLNPIEKYFGGGFVIPAPLQFRPDDEFGIAVGHLENSRPWKQLIAIPSSETVFEMTYKMQVTPWLSVQPDLQVIVNPSANVGQNDSTVFLVRVELDLANMHL